MKISANTGGAAAAPECPPIILSYRFSVSPTKRQHEALARILREQCNLYNAALEARRGAWEWAKRHSPGDFAEAKKEIRQETSFFGQTKQLTEIRAALPEYAAVSVKISRGTLKRLDNSFNNFFGRVKKGAPPGYPKFKPSKHFNTLEINDSGGFRLKSARLYVKGVPGGLRFQMHRPLPSAPRALRLTREVNSATGKARWRVVFACQEETLPPPQGRPAIGVDVGVMAAAACSDGKMYEPPRAAAEIESAQRRAARALARSRNAGGRTTATYRRRKEKLRKLHRHAANVRDYAAHRAANAIVDRAGLVAVEKLNVKWMTAAGGARKRGLNRAIADAAMSGLLHKLEYKSARAGVPFVKVRAAGTSQECSGCGAVVKKTLSVRVHQCPNCGLKLDRDLNAARVILARAAGKENTH